MFVKEMDFEEKIIMYRANHNLTQKELAEKCGVAMQTIYRAEKGQFGKLVKAKIEKVIMEDF